MTNESDRAFSDLMVPSSLAIRATDSMLHMQHKVGSSFHSSFARHAEADEGGCFVIPSSFIVFFQLTASENYQKNFCTNRLDSLPRFQLKPMLHSQNYEEKSTK